MSSTPCSPWQRAWATPVWCVPSSLTLIPVPPALFQRFVQELKLADVAILAEIYAAREKNDLGISSKDLADQIPGAVYCPTLDEVTAKLWELAQPGDLLLTVGAGTSIWRRGPAGNKNMPRTSDGVRGIFYCYFIYICLVLRDIRQRIKAHPAYARRDPTAYGPLKWTGPKLLLFVSI